MKITNTQLKRVIQEELRAVLKEWDPFRNAREAAGGMLRSATQSSVDLMARRAIREFHKEDSLAIKELFQEDPELQNTALDLAKSLEEDEENPFPKWLQKEVWDEANQELLLANVYNTELESLRARNEHPDFSSELPPFEESPAGLVPTGAETEHQLGHLIGRSLSPRVVEDLGPPSVGLLENDLLPEDFKQKQEAALRAALKTWQDEEAEAEKEWAKSFPDPQAHEPTEEELEHGDWFSSGGKIGRAPKDPAQWPLKVK